MESSKHDWTISGKASSLQFFFLKIKKFPIHEFFRSDVSWKLFEIGFPYKHYYFKTCLPTRQNGVQNRDKLGLSLSIVKSQFMT